MPYQNPYKELYPLEIKAPADMLETVAGYGTLGQVKMELAFALESVDENDPATLQWAACLIERRLIDLEA